MIYDTLEIRPVNNKWEIFYTRGEIERELCSTWPSPNGFYHFPRKKFTKEKAFDLLKDKIIFDHENEIARLQASLKDLRNLTLKKRTNA
jgi:hypothetical protein